MNDKKKKKLWRWWPLFAFGIPGIIKLIIIFLLCYFEFFLPYVYDKQLPSLMSDFDQWIAGGFCSVKERYNEEDWIHLPNGEQINITRDAPKNLGIQSITNDKILLYDTTPKEEKTNLFIYSFFKNEEEEYLSIDGDWYFVNDGDGNVAGRNYCKNNKKWEYCFLNVDSGNFIYPYSIQSETEFDDIFKEKQTSKIEYNDNNYYVSFSKKDVVLSASEIDEKVCSLFKKWDFVPKQCIGWSDDSFVLVFKKNSKRSSFFLIRFDSIEKKPIEYQFIPTKDPCLKTIKIYKVLKSFSLPNL
jgi:hypothetical protein